MIQSMTGYGENTIHHKGKEIRISIKSLNSKSLNLHVHLPDYYHSKEMEIRKILSNELERGRVNLFLDVYYTGEKTPELLNESLFRNYYKQLQQLSQSVGAENPSLFEITFQMPDVVRQQEEELEEAEWKRVKKGLQKALSQLFDFREKEGQKIEQRLSSHLEVIDQAHQKIKEETPQREERLLDKIRKDLEHLNQGKNIDEKRLEEELIYYANKMDITEENNRLKAHIDHFQSTLKSNDNVGKKLDFIAQEMHREINTLGAKANDSDIQKRVVRMKDELAKIREQVFNVV